MTGCLVPRVGDLPPDLAAELPGLALHWLRLPPLPPPGGQAPTSRDLVGRLGTLANGFRGAAVVAMRTKPVPAAYRTFYRQIGLDPDTHRIPIEQAAVERLFHGTFRPRGRLADALLLALLETSVPLWALDAERVSPSGLGIRATDTGESVGEGEARRALVPGTLVVADRERIHAVLFDPPTASSSPGRDGRGVVLYAVSVAGVPAIHVEEAFWLAAEALGIAFDTEPNVV